jgi:hypothetical protein
VGLEVARHFGGAADDFGGHVLVVVIRLDRGSIWKLESATACESLAAMS